MTDTNAQPWLDPTPEMLNDPTFNAIWDVIKTWDISVPEQYEGYCGATGNHARAILDALHTDEHPSAEDYRNRAERAEQALAERDAEIVRLREALHEVYWEAMNLGTTHKWLASNDGEIDECSPSFTVSQVLHEFARKVIKPAAQVNGVELYK